MSDVDVAVALVGGGPAGSTTALSLVREHGVRPEDVAIVEKAVHPREKPCAGAISAWGLRALEELGEPLSVPSAPMLGVRVLRAGEVGATEARMGAVVRRSAFDASLFASARRAGVRAFEGEALVGIAREGGGFALRTSKRTVRAKLLAACDGAGSTTRKLLGVREAARKGHLYVTETPEAEGDEGTARGLCDFDLSPVLDGLEGYYWDFPTVIDGARWVSRGIYHANLTPRSNVKASLLAHLARRGVAHERARLKPFSTRPFVRGAPLWGDGWVLVGEAAGIDRTTGEGIAQAILFGRMAAEHLARAARTGERTFERYERDVLGSTMGRHLLQSAVLARFVFARAGRPFQDFLLRSPYARAQAARWYEGDPLEPSTIARLGAGLVRHLL